MPTSIEMIPATFRYDWSDERRFEEGELVLEPTAVTRRAADGSVLDTVALSDIVRVEATDRAGLGTLDLVGRQGLLLRVRYTFARVRDAVVFAEAVERAIGNHADTSAPAIEPPSAEAAPSHHGASLLLRLFPFARRHVAALSLGALLTLGTTAAGLVPPLLTWPLVDDIVAPYQQRVKEAREASDLSPAARDARLSELKQSSRGPFSRVPLYLAGMLAAALAAWLIGWAQGWVLARLSERISADLRNTTYAHLQRLSLDYFGAKRTGDLVSRISSDTDRICNFLSDSLTDFVLDALMIIGIFATLFKMDAVLATAALCTFPVVGWLTWFMRTRLRQGFRAANRAWAEMTSILADTIPGVRVVKAFAQERREIRRFRTANARIVAANDRLNRLWTLFWPTVTAMNAVGLVVAWGVGVWRVQNQAITLGALTAFVAYIGRFYSRVESMSRMTNATARATASAQRIFEILDRAPSVPEPANPIHPGKIRGAISLSRVSFRYGARQVVDDVSLDIAPGEMIGLVGPTGSGKSTLLNLVCRFYDVSEGAIRVDGTDIRSFPTEEWRGNIGIVLQDPFLFYGTIADNIAYGKPAATRSEIIAAARAARAHEFILQLPDGYDSLVGERGQTLSGGERQRISIARALLIDPKLLILDEATSSVDTETERKIQDALDTAVEGRTTIAIAHRLSTLRNADRLVVFEAGRIVEIGSHEDLLPRGGLYTRLYEAQRAIQETEGRAA